MSGSWSTASQGDPDSCRHVVRPKPAVRSMGRRALPKIDPHLGPDPLADRGHGPAGSMGRRVAFWASAPAGNRGRVRQGAVPGARHRTQSRRTTFWGSRSPASTLASPPRSLAAPGVRERQGRAGGRRAAVSRPTRSTIRWRPCTCTSPIPGGNCGTANDASCTTGFLTDVQRVLRPGGALHFWTDVQEYFDTTLELIRQTTQLSRADDSRRAAQRTRPGLPNALRTPHATARTCPSIAPNSASDRPAIHLLAGMRRLVSSQIAIVIVLCLLSATW